MNDHETCLGITIQNKWESNDQGKHNYYTGAPFYAHIFYSPNFIPNTRVNSPTAGQNQAIFLYDVVLISVNFQATGNLHFLYAWLDLEGNTLCVCSCVRM